MANGNPDDEELRLKVVYEASPAVKQATDDLRKLKEETSALEAVMSTLDTKVDEAGAGFKQFYTDTTGVTSALNTLEIQVAEVGIGFTGLSAPVAIADQEFNNLTKTVVAAAGTGSGESGVGGFAGLTKNIFMGERALTALATGHGIARVGPMLEKLIGAAGGPAGVGFGIAGLAYLLETIGPKVEGFLRSWAEASGIMETQVHVKELADELERALKAADALEKTPTAQAAKTKAMVGAAITARGEPKIEEQIELALTKTRKLEEYITDEEFTDKEGKKTTHADIEAWKHLTADPLETLDPAIAERRREAMKPILERARERRRKEAEAWVGQLPTDKASRQGLQQLAKAAPGVFGGQFLDELAMAEPEAQIEAEQIKKGETGAGKEMDTWRNKRKDQIKRDKAFQHDVAIGQRVTDEAVKEEKQTIAHGAEQRYQFEQHLEAEQRKTDAAAARDKEHKRKQAEQKAAKHDRENAPTARGAHAEKEEKEMYLDAVQRFGPQDLGPDLQRAAAKHARENHQAGFDMSATFQQALDYAIMQARGDFARGIQAGMKRQMSYGEMRGQ